MQLEIGIDISSSCFLIWLNSEATIQIDLCSQLKLPWQQCRGLAESFYLDIDIRLLNAQAFQHFLPFLTAINFIQFFNVKKWNEALLDPVRSATCY